MSDLKRDHSLDNLFDLHDIRYFIGEKGHSVRFDIQKVTETPNRPHGLKYALTVHNPKGARIAGFDNAHSVKKNLGPGGKRDAYDHKHRFRTVRPYDYKDAASLLEDFWKLAEDVLNEEGVRL